MSNDKIDGAFAGKKKSQMGARDGGSIDNW